MGKGPSRPANPRQRPHLKPAQILLPIHLRTNVPPARAPRPPRRPKPRSTRPNGRRRPDRNAHDRRTVGYCADGRSSGPA
jgi:hypothetical protein